LHSLSSNTSLPPTLRAGPLTSPTFTPPLAAFGPSLYVATPRQRLSNEERERRLDDAVQRFVGDVIGLDYPASTFLDRVSGELDACLPKKEREAGMTLAIDVNALCVQYGRKRALDHLTLSLPAGGIHALLGANGAGKKTLFGVLLGFETPLSGSARILSCDSAQLTHLVVFNQGDDLEARLRLLGARSVHTMPVSLDRAINGFLASSHGSTTPFAAAA